MNPADLNDISAELSHHSATHDHALDHDEGGWYCRTCRSAIGPQPDPLTDAARQEFRDAVRRWLDCNDDTFSDGQIDATAEAWGLNVIEVGSRLAELKGKWR